MLLGDSVVFAERRVKQGRIFDIQRFSLNDGPGIRTTVFFKGCPLRCLWCDNPESQSSLPQLFFFEAECTRCYRCVDACPEGATERDANGRVTINRALCKACAECIKVCPSGARVMSGKLMSVEEVLRVATKDALFYRNSGGGLTCSGGEATSQPDFLLDLFKRCQAGGIHTTLDTSGYVQWEVLAQILDYVDLVLFDIKHMDPVKHAELTGVDNRPILENARRLAEVGQSFDIRMPLIPGYNDSEENIKSVGEFMGELGMTRIDILPYHRLGSKKYERLGMRYSLSEVKPYSDEEIEAIRAIFQSYRIEALVA